MHRTSHQKVNPVTLIILSPDWTISEALVAVFSGPEREIFQYRTISEMEDQCQPAGPVGYVILTFQPRHAVESIYKVRQCWPDAIILFFADCFLFSDKVVARYFQIANLYLYNELSGDNLPDFNSKGTHCKNSFFTKTKKENLNQEELIRHINLYLMVELQRLSVSRKMQEFIISERNNAIRLSNNKKAHHNKTKEYYYYRETLMSYLQIKHYARDFMESVYIRNITENKI